jgi:para-aminobenzoate synthetase component 1
MRCAPRVLEIRGAPDAGEMVSRLRERRGLVALDSAAGEPRKWSLVAFDPLAGFAPPDSIASVRRLLRELEIAGGDDVPGPFQGGFVGAFSYDLGVAGERAPDVPDDPWHSPLAVGGLYVDFVVRDEASGRAWLVLGEGALDGRPPAASRREEVLALLSGPFRAPTNPAPLGPLVRHTSAAEHRRRVDVLRERIAAGDLYQANLAHRFTRAMSGDPADLYAELRRRNPAPYMAYLAWDERLASRAARFPRGAILSASPELFLEMDAGIARTRPIKGTARRSADPARDRANAEALMASAKDRAELAMIVDLERNDLGRCARAGGVHVEGFPRLQSLASVHHLVADVVAEIPPGRDAIDVLTALFPGGSITGAPKLAAMDAIARLEGEGRGFFTGSLGFVDVRGRALWNILIRTLVWRPAAEGGEVSFHAGGGVTWSSDAAAEERETLDKAAALIEALEPRTGATGAHGAGA